MQIVSSQLANREAMLGGMLISVYPATIQSGNGNNVAEYGEWGGSSRFSDSI